MDSETIKIIEISSRNDLKRFVTFPFKLYRDNPYWTPPITKEEIDRAVDKLKELCVAEELV